MAPNTRSAHSGAMTVSERIQQDSCVYEAGFPPSVPEGRPLREAKAAPDRGSVLARLLRLAGARR
jgi:hypothetical protein